MVGPPRFTFHGSGALVALAGLVACGQANPGQADHGSPEVGPGPDTAALDHGPPGEGCAGLPEGSACDDQNVCTTGDRCQQGVCVGAVNVPCDDKLCQDVVCDPSLGCQYAPSPVDTACKADCFGLAACDGAGNCAPDLASKRFCTPDPGSCAGSMHCENDACVVDDYLPEGAPCDADGAKCTVDTCTSAHECLPTGQEPCAKELAENPCKEWTCQPATGTCQGAPKPALDGAKCKDETPCTDKGTCDDKGNCWVLPKATDDANPCTEDYCDVVAGVGHDPKTDGSPCETGLACQALGTCLSGACANECECLSDADCAPSSPCLGSFACNTATWKCEQIVAALVCPAPASPPNDGCTLAACDVVGGAAACVPAKAADGTPCPATHPCALGQDHGCQEGVCQPVLTPQCDDGNPCNGAESCDPTQGCQPGTPLDPSDGIPCTLDACDPSTGAMSHLPLDTACDDTVFCNGGEVCDPGTGCKAGLPPDPGDGVACTVDTCDPGLDAPVHTPDHTACADESPCTLDSCDLFLGCTATQLPEMTPCDDASLCTANDRCTAAGTCEGTACEELGQVCAADGCHGLGALRWHTAALSQRATGGGLWVHAVAVSSVGGLSALAGELRALLGHLAMWFEAEE